MITHLMVDPIPETAYFEKWYRRGARLGLPADFDLHKEKMARLSATGASSAAIEDFLKLVGGGDINCIRSAAGSARCVAAGISSYSSFCSLIGRPFIPPADEVFFIWGAAFRVGATFRNYLWRLGKSCYLRNAPTDWYSPVVGGASNGLWGAVGRSLNSLIAYIQDSFRISNGLGMGGQFYRISLVAFLYSLGSHPGHCAYANRAPGIGCPILFLMMAMSFSGFALSSGFIASLSGWHGGKIWPSDVSLRGSPLVQRALIGPGTSSPPPRRIWPLPISSCREGELPFPEFPKSNSDRALKFNLTKMAFREAPKYTSKPPPPPRCDPGTPEDGEALRSDQGDRGSVAHRLSYLPGPRSGSRLTHPPRPHFP